MKAAILTFILAPIVALAPTNILAAEANKDANRSKASKAKTDKVKKRAIRSTAKGRSVARVIRAVRVAVSNGKARISAKRRATRRVNPRGSMMFDLK